MPDRAERDMLDQERPLLAGRRPRGGAAATAMHGSFGGIGRAQLAPGQYRSTIVPGATGIVSCPQKSSASAIRFCRSRSSAARRRSLSAGSRALVATPPLPSSNPSRRSSASTSFREQPAWHFTISPRGPSRSAIARHWTMHRAAAAGHSPLRYPPPNAAAISAAGTTTGPPAAFLSPGAASRARPLRRSEVGGLSVSEVDERCRASNQPSRSRVS